MTWGSRKYDGVTEKYAQYLAQRSADCWADREERRAAGPISAIAKFGSKQVTCGSCGDLHTTHKRARRFTRCPRCWMLVEQARAAAMLIVARAVKRGDLHHPSALQCADCDAPAIEYDHRDYSQPLKVDPVCRKHNLLRGAPAPFNRFAHPRASATASV